MTRISPLVQDNSQYNATGLIFHSWLICTTPHHLSLAASFFLCSTLSMPNIKHIYLILWCEMTEDSSSNYLLFTFMEEIYINKHNRILLLNSCKFETFHAWILPNLEWLFPGDESADRLSGPMQAWPVIREMATKQLQQDERAIGYFTQICFDGWRSVTLISGGISNIYALSLHPYANVLPSGTCSNWRHNSREVSHSQWGKALHESHLFLLADYAFPTRQHNLHGYSPRFTMHMLVLLLSNLTAISAVLLPSWLSNCRVFRKV